MNKTAIKNFAIWARVNLIESAKQRAFEYEITKDGVNTASVDVIAGRVLSKEEKEQRNQLLNEIKDKGFDQVMEEAAYTWFNRFIALRYMEVNGYLPSKVRVFSNEDGEFKPAILDEAMTVEIEGLDREKVLDLLDKQDNENLYKTLLIAQCNSLSVGLPYMFEKISNWTELLFPKNLLKVDSVIGQMVVSIPERDWEDAVQIIGWLYQYYNSELKDETFALLKNNIKITKEHIPAATQLFTPEWIVRYMVENSLGHIWNTAHSEDGMKLELKYYLDEKKQNADIAKLTDAEVTYYRGKNLDEITFIDPCMGSGHILVYAFDVFMSIYLALGWSERDAARNIIEKNIYGLDIDDRAGQLAYFAIMMKARKYNRKILNGDCSPNVMSIIESDFMSDEFIEYVAEGKKQISQELALLRKCFDNAKEYGSILEAPTLNYDELLAHIESIESRNVNNIFEVIYRHEVNDKLIPLVKQARVLTKKYSVVATNPPYMGADGMSEKLSKYVKKNYPDSKSDMYAVFVERCGKMLEQYGYQAMITQHSWMFLSSFENLRGKIINSRTIISMAHLGARAFEEISGEVVQTVSWIMKNGSSNYEAVYQRLVEPNSQDGKEQLFLDKTNIHFLNQDAYKDIPGMPIAYWISEQFQLLFEKGSKITDYVSSRDGLTTGKNDLFIRYFWEVPHSHISFGQNDAEAFWNTGRKFAPLLKGGTYRKWYGNNWFVITYDRAGFEKLSNCGNKLPSREVYFLPFLSWNRISTRMSFRFAEAGYLFESASLVAFAKSEADMLMAISFANTKLADAEMKMINPTTNMLTGYFDELRVPEVDREKCCLIAQECIDICRSDWNSFETSWDFERNPLLPQEGILESKIEVCFDKWKEVCCARFNKLKENEELLNSIYIEAAGLINEMDISVPDADISVRLADSVRDIKMLISYSVGCMFGRYSVGKKGIVSSFDDEYVDSDNIIPITDDEYFSDDIVSKFVSFVCDIYGEKYLEENLDYIAKALGGRGSSRQIIRDYFCNGFFSDHIKNYQKAPIYWLFDSGKKNGFKCLIYMHRYQPDTIARIRTDYIHELQARYRTAIEEIERNMDSADAKERVKMNKQLSKLQDQELELRAYEEKIHHLADQMIEIDLDDGVKANYAKFQDVLAPIK